MPLVGENRVIAKLGLERLSKDRTRWAAGAARTAGPDRKAIDGFHIGFMLAPRINAAGRMSSPDLAARLLLAWDEAQLDEVRRWPSSSTTRTRGARKKRPIVADAKKLVETDPDVGAHNVLVVGGEGWHRGVIGIVASKLVDRVPQAGHRALHRRR